jgi:L-asparaginase II
MDFPEGEHFVIEERNGLVEAYHRAHVAVVDTKGNIRFSSGDPHHFTFTRSCIKPIQALPVLVSGAADHFEFTEEEIAMCMASHSGQDFHIRIIESMMEKIGINMKNLECGGHSPFHKETAKSLKGDFTQLHDNCSGKHTGAIAVCKSMNWDTKTYTSLDHPLTREIVRIIAELSGMGQKDIHLGFDGCDIPNFGMPIDKLALLFAKLADPGGIPLQHHLERMKQAFIRNPRIIAGDNRFDTVLMMDHPGKLLSKAGAAGLQTMAAKIDGEWIGIAVKIEDGSYPACEPLSFHVLKEIGLFNESGKSKKYNPKILMSRSKKPVGSIRAFGRLSDNIDRKTE